MKKYIPLFLILASCSAYPRSVTRAFNAHGSAYTDSLKSCLIAGQCRDLTDEECEDAKNMPGNGYRDAKDGAKEAPIHSPEEETALCAQHVFDDENGTIVIIEDDGEVIIIEPEEMA
jgi:hypothetical protein